jgi:hypothetical protein
MTQQFAVWLVLLLAVVAANLPFLTERLLLVGPRRMPKVFAWRLLELLLLYVVILALGTALEANIGQRALQDWQFFAAFACLFITLSFPGFVWRYLRRSSGVAEA